jgi:tetratricopeptide (TPR) repeat protein
VSKGQFTEAIAHYRKLPEKIQENNWILVTYLGALSRQLDTPAEDYRAAVEKFRKLYADEVALGLISIYYYSHRDKYDEALKAVDRLDKAVGGDPFLNVVRGITLAGAKRYKEARVAAEKAIREEPTLEDAYWVRIDVSLRERNYADTLEWLKKMVQACQAPVDNMATDPDYAAFVQSPQYREWQEWYQAQLKK